MLNVEIMLLLITVLLTVALLVVTVLLWRFPKASNASTTQTDHRFPKIGLNPEENYPAIHATNGVPTLQQLTEGIELTPEALGLARSIYGSGLKQFNHYVNNRDGVIEESRREMDKIRDSLSQSEASEAEAIGTLLAITRDKEQQETARSKYELLMPPARIYAEHKKRELEALQTIARDLEKGVPRTDYTSVKSRIAAGNTNLTSLVSELPISWQSLRTLDEKVKTNKPTGKPPKREFLHVMFLTKEQGLLEDKKAERDGNWITSNNILAPYQEPVPLLQFIRPDAPPVQTGKVIFINQDPTSEWETELWRQGGYADQWFLRAKAGTLPEQLRKAHRLRKLNVAGWVFAGVSFVFFIFSVVLIYL